MWRVAVVDDQAQVRGLMKAYFDRFAEEYQERFQLSFFENPMLLLNRYAASYDLILMDIDMPLMSGMEAARRLRSLDEQVVLIFLTNLAQYAIEGYEVRAVDYILKPLDYERFTYKLKRALKLVPPRETPLILLKTETGSICLERGRLTYVEVEGHYLSYHTQEKTYRVRGSLKRAAESLPPPAFFLCNQCYLVNLSYVEQIKGNLVTVAGEEILISRPRKKSFLEALAAYPGR